MRLLLLLMASSTSSSVGGPRKAEGGVTPGGCRIGQLAPLDAISTSAINQVDDLKNLNATSLSYELTRVVQQQACQFVLNLAGPCCVR